MTKDKVSALFGSLEHMYLDATQSTKQSFIDNLFGWAMQNGKHQLAKDLLEHHPKINQYDSSCQTPLMFAAQRGDTEMVSLLVKKGAWVDARDKKGRSALIHATHDLQFCYKTERACNVYWYVHPIDRQTPCSSECARILLKEGGETYYHLSKFSHMREKPEDEWPFRYEENKSLNVKTWRPFHITATLTAMWAQCEDCTKITANHWDSWYYCLPALADMVEHSPYNPDMYQILRNACVLRITVHNLQDRCKQIIRESIFRYTRTGLYARTGLYLSVEALPLPKSMKGYLLNVESGDDYYIYRKVRGFPTAIEKKDQLDHVEVTQRKTNVKRHNKYVQASDGLEHFTMWMF